MKVSEAKHETEETLRSFIKQSREKYILNIIPPPVDSKVIKKEFGLALQSLEDMIGTRFSDHSTYLKAMEKRFEQNNVRTLLIRGLAGGLSEHQLRTGPRNGRGLPVSIASQVYKHWEKTWDEGAVQERVSNQGRKRRAKQTIDIQVSKARRDQ